MKYRCVWIDDDSKTQLGVLTNLQDAKDEAEFKHGLGFIAWVENEDSERIA